MPPDAFFIADGDRFVPTEFARGPWSADALHAGPPSALLGRAVEAVEPLGEMLVSRFALEVLRPIPCRPLSIRAEVERPGRRVQLVRAALCDAGTGEEVALASAWRIRPEEGLAGEVNLPATELPGPDDCPTSGEYDPGWAPNYFHAMEWRTAGGDWGRPGPTAMWMRMRIPLVDGEEISPLSRVLAAADSGNGISWEFPMTEVLFVNVDLTVHLARMPEGEWVCLDAITRVGSEGLGVARSTMWDRRGWVGEGAQSLLVAPR